MSPRGKAKYLGDGIWRIRYSRRYGGLRQSQAVLACHRYTHEPNYPAFIFAEVLEARAFGTRVVGYQVPLCNTQYDDDNFDRVLSTHWYCGDVNRDESINATDALLALKGAAGAQTCPFSRCDTDRSGGLSSRDALRILQFAIGWRVSLLCSGCS